MEEVIRTVVPKPGEREDAGLAENVYNGFHRTAVLWSHRLTPFIKSAVSCLALNYPVRAADKGCP
jgi:hypothetical protein